MSKFNISNVHRALVAVLVLAMAQCANAHLSKLSDKQMSKVAGKGLGIVFQNFVFEHGTNAQNGQIFKIGGIKSSTGQDVTVTVNELYIARAGSNYGQNLQPVNLGRLINPYTIDVVNGDNIGIPGKAVLQIAAPTMVDSSVGYDCLDPSAAAGSGTCSSRPASATYANGDRPDIGMQMSINVGGTQAHDININAKSAVIDGSYIRLWGDDSHHRLVAQIKLNFFTPELSISSCNMSGTNCGSTIYLNNFSMQLALGNELQPASLNVDPTGNFVFQVQDIPKPAAGTIAADGLRSDSDTATWDYYNSYYTDPKYRSSITIGDLKVGSQDFGSAAIQGMLIQHLKITTHNLP